MRTWAYAFIAASFLGALALWSAALYTSSAPRDADMGWAGWYSMLGFAVIPATLLTLAFAHDRGRLERAPNYPPASEQEAYR